jgi:hypothetical protein
MLTQRELDEVYRPENVQYGWEFPTQLLVIIICFTYACICPIILPVGAIFFGMALMVYKKQLLYVYTPVYESGGALFPDVCQKTLGGLICGQLTFIGYTIIRGCRYEVCTYRHFRLLRFSCRGQLIFSIQLAAASFPLAVAILHSLGD